MNKGKYTSQTNQQNLPRRRSLAELDDVIDEILDRNPDFVVQLEKIIEETKKEQNAVSRRSRSR